MIDDIKANLITAKKLKIGTVLISKKKSPLLTNNKIDYVFGDITSIIKKINDKDIFNETR